MSLEENKCSVCLSAGFKSGTLDENNVCTQCNKLWPGAKKPDDRNKKKKPEVESREVETKELVTKQVNELLEEYGILHRCLDCSNFYYKRSPAQKRCGDCSETISVVDKKETK